MDMSNASPGPGTDETDMYTQTRAAPRRSRCSMRGGSNPRCPRRASCRPGSVRAHSHHKSGPRMLLGSARTRSAGAVSTGAQALPFGAVATAGARGVRERCSKCVWLRGGARRARVLCCTCTTAEHMCAHAHAYGCASMRAPPGGFLGCSLDCRCHRMHTATLTVRHSASAASNARANSQSRARCARSRSMALERSACLPARRCALLRPCPGPRQTVCLACVPSLVVDAVAAAARADRRAPRALLAQPIVSHPH
jgi:hypothetical protein